MSCPSTPLQSGFRSKNEFERVTGEIPIDKFNYGSLKADWMDWSQRFENAVQVSTNAHGRKRLEELCLMWIPLKLNDEAQPIYARCKQKNKSWPLLREELAEAFEDVRMRRQWNRNKDAYQKPADMSLQVYRANVIGLVNKYSPGLTAHEDLYADELYVRFIAGLEDDWREYIEEAFPYTEETLENAYSFALKYEAKLAQKKSAKPVARKAKSNTSALSAMKDEKSPSSYSKELDRLQYEVDKLKLKWASRRRKEESSSDESESESESDDQELGAKAARPKRR